MHSLKNTIIAVGLLGLSFWFYQASTKTGPDLSDQIPSLEISDGTESTPPLSANEVAQPKSNLNAFPSIQNNKPFPQGPPANKLDTSNSKIPSAPQRDMALAQTSEPDLPAIQKGFSLSNQPRVPQTPLTTNARDEGLIDALDSQNKRLVDREPAEQPINDNHDESQFNSQPIASSDSSYNRLANDSRPIGAASPIAQVGLEPAIRPLTFQAVWPQVDKLVISKNYRGALQLLSSFYRNTILTGPERQRLLPWLDALAGKVIFSEEHHLEKMPYTVANESLTDIAQRWNVPAQLIYNINKKRIPNPAVIAPGTKLKIVKGPFHGEVSMSGKVMTLFLGDLYAGRYPVTVGISGNPSPGGYRVLVKSEGGHSWRDAEGNEFPPGSPQNGYGLNWIGLSQQLCIHAIPDGKPEGHSGCIGLNLRDSKDVFGILTTASNIKILR